MTPNYLNSLQSSPFLAGSSNIEDDQQFHHQLFGPSFHHQHDASSSSHSFHFYFNPTQDQVGYNYHNELVNHQHQQKFDQGNESVVAYGGSYDNSYEVQNKVEKGLTISFGSNEGKQKIGDQQANNDDKNNSAKWMSSKTKMMHQNKKSDEREDSQKLPFNKNNESIDSQDHGSNCASYNSNNPIRVCSDCNTTKTPLWRSGPKGPKSLCNACGIRQRKARRALAAAAAIADETTPSPPPPPPPTTKTVKIKLNHQKAKNNYGINGLSTVPFKKRCRITTSPPNASLAVESSSDQEPTQAKKLGFEDFLINLSNKLAFHHVFPQDETEAAILLMALSCGLVHG